MEYFIRILVILEQKHFLGISSCKFDVHLDIDTFIVSKFYLLAACENYQIILSNNMLNVYFLLHFLYQGKNLYFTLENVKVIFFQCISRQILWFVCWYISISSIYLILSSYYDLSYDNALGGRWTNSNQAGNLLSLGHLTRSSYNMN